MSPGPQLCGREETDGRAEGGGAELVQEAKRGRDEVDAITCSLFTIHCHLLSGTEQGH